MRKASPWAGALALVVAGPAALLGVSCLALLGCFILGMVSAVLTPPVTLIAGFIGGMYLCDEEGAAAMVVVWVAAVVAVLSGEWMFA